MNRVLSLNLLFVILTSASAKNATTAPAPYKLVIQEVHHPDKSTPFSIQLRHVKSGKLLWIQNSRYVARAKWSRYHRAVAVAVADRLLVWREGERLRSVVNPDDYL